MKPDSWIPRVAAAALASFADTMSFLGLANGKHQGPEYLPLNPRRPDNSPGSFSINTTTGAWGDFAIGASGLDLVSLAAYLADEKQSDAARRLAQHFSIAVPARKDGAPQAAGDPGKARAPAAPPKPRQGPQNGAGHSAGECVLPVPDDAPARPQRHPKLGAPSQAWEYRDAAGRLLFLVCRFDQAKGGKEIRPLSLRRMPSEKLEWRWLGVDPQRPPYGLDRLAARPDAVVMICEGEKAADAAALLFPDHVAITSPNGAKAADKTDWSALAGRRCVLWPDADEAGEAYAAEVCKRLHAAGAADVRRLNAAGFLTLLDGAIREALPAGWDAADAVAEGYTAALVAERLAALPDAFPVFEKAAPATAAIVGAGDTASDAATGPRPHFYVDARGTWYVGVSKDGELIAPRWICRTLDVIAMVRDPSQKGWGKLVEFLDPDRQPHREVIHDAMLSGDGAELEKLLRGWGLQIAPKGRPLLLEYLMTQQPKARARTTARTGWHESGDGRVFVLPDRAIGKADEVWLFEDGAAAADYRERGTLDEWRQEVAALCLDNSRLTFAVCLAFAAPLLDLVGGESGGIHYSGESGDGKTTALRVAASVCGGPEYMKQWRASDNSMEYLALQHCDALLAMDELAQINAKVLGDTIYMLGNANGKNRARAQGGLRETAKFRILFLSTGEVGMAAHVASVGMATTAGMEGRMAEIPARVCDTPPGIYEALHGEASPKALSQRLAHAVKKYHGTAFPAFLAELVKRDPDEMRETLLKARKLFAERYLTHEAGNQVLRVADRCALVGAAGELATRWGITGWPAGAAMTQAGVCFDAWLHHRGGEGNQEERAMLMQVRGFLEMHGEARFSDWRRSVAKDTHANRVMNRAGWRRLMDKDSGRLVDATPDEGGYLSDDVVTEYLVLSQVFKNEVCKGFNPRTVAKLLAGRGFLKTEKEHFAVKIKPPGEAYQRMFHILPAIFDDE
ncbi:MAG: DUF927 domain-containing protein [Sulfuritalea sp.]|nr:DUF927 domain-containing protein [Sulfuritalea sp.]MDP1981755.1 DUF927 domain-containing protein [Sulfuritalea sp.]